MLISKNPIGIADKHKINDGCYNKRNLLKTVIEIKHWHLKGKHSTIMRGIILCGTLKH